MRRWFFALSQKFGEDNVPRLAAATSYYAALSLAPLLVLAVAIAAQVYGNEGHAKSQLLAQIVRFAGPQVSEFSETLLTNSAKPQASIWATALSIIVTVFSASNLFGAINEAIFSIWKLSPDQNFLSNLIKTRLIAFLSVILFGALLIGWLILESWLAFAGSVLGGEAGRIGSTLAAIPFFTLAVGAVYRAIPPGKTSWRDVWGGAALVAVFLTFAKYLMGLYFGWAKVSAVYGSAGALVVVLLWIYYTSLIFFVGAEIVYIQTHRVRLKAEPGAPEEPTRS